MGTVPQVQIVFAERGDTITGCKSASSKLVALGMLTPLGVTFIVRRGLVDNHLILLLQKLRK